MSFRHVALAAVITAVGFSLPSSLAGVPTIEYTVRMPEPWTHLFYVDMRISGVSSRQQILDLKLPVWRSGRYVVLDFAGGVVAFSASTAEGAELPWGKVDKSTWRIQKGTSTGVIVRYTIYADDFVNRTRGLNEQHAFIDGSAVFMYVQELRKVSPTLTVVPYHGWHVTTGMDSLPGDRYRFSAPTYDHLIDCPLEIGTQKDYTFEVEGKPHVISIYGELGCDVDSLIAQTSAIITMNARYWGGLPYRRYVFLMHAFPGAGGGTEHLNSTILGVQPIPPPVKRPCRELRGLMGHEFFHTWNVKQFRPRGMDPYDWSKENYFRELWIAEGSTSYMHNLLQVRNGMTSAHDYLLGLAASVRTERVRPGNRVQSLSECSVDSWVKFRRAGQDDINFETDLYEKGAQVSLCLDLEIRHQSENRHSFDDLLRTLLRRFPMGSGGYTVDDVEQIAGEMAGTPMKDFFAAFVHGVRPLEWDRVLAYAGLRIDTVDSLRKPALGVATNDQGGRTVVHQVMSGFPAYRAGLNAGDEIIALDGFRVSTVQLADRIRDHAVGDTVLVTVFRENVLRSIPIVLDVVEYPTYTVRRVDNPTPQQKAIYASWLNNPW